MRSLCQCSRVAPVILFLLASSRAIIAAPQETERFTRTLKVGRNGSLTLSNLSGDIVVRGVAGDEIHIEAVKRAGSGNARRQLESTEIQVTQTGDRVRVHTRYPENGGHVSVDYDVSLPEGTSVTLSSVSGDIELEGVEGETQIESVSGEVKVNRAGRLVRAKSVSGDVTVDAASSRAELEISSVSGDVRVNGVTATSLEVGSVSGDVLVGEATSDRATLKSVSGDIRYSGPFAPSGRYEFKSHSGDVRIVISNDAGFELDAKTFSGEIESEFPLTVHSMKERRKLSGVYGDGGAFIDASSFSGSITLSKR